MGHSHEVPASLPGCPVPDVHWLREEAEKGVLWISPNTPGYTVASSGQQHSLVLLDVGRQHQGTYTCIVSNAAGQALCSASLHVTGCEWGGWWSGGDASTTGVWSVSLYVLGPTWASETDQPSVQQVGVISQPLDPSPSPYFSEVAIGWEMDRQPGLRSGSLSEGLLS